MKKLFFIFLFNISLFATEDSYFLDYIYVNANTGQSSGGHSAIRLGKIVYHFQYFPDKIFHIIREPWEDFRYVYGIQENRTIYILKIELDKKVFNHFFERLNEIYLYQKKELDNLEKLENDVKILESILKGDGRVYLKGTGYFSNHLKNDKSYYSLKTRIASSLGRNYILKELISIRRKINQFQIPSNGELEIDMSKLRYPITVDNYSTDYLESLSYLKSLEILQDELDLKKDGYFEFAGNSINKNIFDKLSNSLKEKENEIVQLLQSKNEMNGYSLLISIARYLVIRKSLEERKLFFLNSFGKNHSLVVGDALENRTFLEGIDKQITTKIKNHFLEIENTDSLSERKYTELEDLINRKKEITDGINEKKAIRVNHEIMLPSKEDSIYLYKYESLSLDYERIYKLYLKNRDKYLLSLQNKYPFNLFTRNCTTEIFRTLNSIMGENPMKLGEIIQEKDSFVFVPVYAYYSVGKKYKVTREEKVPSLRTMILNEKSKKNYYNRLKEISTLSSEYYRFNQEDSIFIFFTDEEIFFRPLFGFINLISGIGELGYGVVISPFDGGDRVVKGLQGIFFSGPELIFFNIRKGTFIYEGNSFSSESE